MKWGLVGCSCARGAEYSRGRLGWALTNISLGLVFGLCSLNSANLFYVRLINSSYLCFTLDEIPTVLTVIIYYFLSVTYDISYRLLSYSHSYAI